MHDSNYTIQINNQGKIKLSVFFPKSKVKQLNLTLDSGADAIAVINDYFFDAALVSEADR